jgi:hypothetical protein
MPSRGGLRNHASDVKYFLGSNFTSVRRPLADEHSARLSSIQRSSSRRVGHRAMLVYQTSTLRTLCMLHFAEDDGKVSLLSKHDSHCTHGDLLEGPGPWLGQSMDVVGRELRMLWSENPDIDFDLRSLITGNKSKQGITRMSRTRGLCWTDEPTCWNGVVRDDTMLDAATRDV